MKLYKFLIIDNDILEKFFIARNPKDDIKAAINDNLLDIGTPKRNRIYTYIDDKKVVLMSFKYPNTYLNISSNTKVYEWAYTLIDDDMKEVIQKQRWGTNVDKKLDEKKGGRIELTSSLGCKRYMYLRDGGHLGNTKHRLHEYILKPEKFNRKKERVHHKGHAFDNRKGYLERVSVSKHKLIHNNWEPEKQIYRARKVQLNGGYNTEIDCDCNTRSCSNCDSVLLIKTQEQLQRFINQINSKEYKDLSGWFIYRDVKVKK